MQRSGISEGVGPFIEQFNPHWIFCCAGGLSFTPYASARIRKRYCLTGMALSDPDAFAVSTQHICSTFDRYFTNSRAAVEMYASIGTKADWFPFSCYPPYHRKVPSSPEYECEVLFVGQGRPDRVALVRRIATLFDTRVFGAAWDAFGVPNGGFLSAQQFITAANSAKVCIDFARNWGGDCMVKHRIFELAACGAVVCTERFDDLALHFKYGEEILGVRYRRSTDNANQALFVPSRIPPAYLRARATAMPYRAHVRTPVETNCGLLRPPNGVERCAQNSIRIKKARTCDNTRLTRRTYLNLLGKSIGIGLVGRQKARCSKRYDVLVYGGTPAGICAAVAAARRGAEVALIEPGLYLGGMVSSGLGASDVGDPRVIGGLAMEFFQEAGKHYGTGMQYSFTPSVTESAFKNLVAKSG